MANTPEEELHAMRAAVALNAFCFGMWAKEGDTEIDVDKAEVEKFIPGIERALKQIDIFDKELAAFNDPDKWLINQTQEIEKVIDVQGVAPSMIQPLARVIIGKLIELRKTNG